MPVDAPIKLDFYENGSHQRIAHFIKNGVHLTVAPHNVGFDGKQMSGWEVFFWGDNKGKPDTSHVLESIVLDGDIGDQEEIADTYARRLESGINPKDMFKDVTEQNRKNINELIEDLEAGRLK